MRILFFVQRFLATLIDLIIVYLPVLLLVQLIFTNKEVGGIGNFLAAILFVLYNLISESSFQGKTIGKFFAKLKVKTISTDLLEVCQREMAKLLYFLPMVGWIFVLVSVVMYFVNGQFLHDKIGRSEVTVSD
ncbi:RDD family protein [Lactococcus lactis]|uniref:Membrane protein n=1 Tax=Lactococcus lactis subsp. lactis A12 TaxID=1137134 RepID=S6FEC9_LACLL|nr:RDD family protein [Lactococcus lactis]KST87344.1 membrane protein [Lactococcus lactis subsp. lactis]MDT2905665.1 RDD family protein [Lactococcus lactis]CDG03621.1 Putative membrane protein [Lactococcus lactis subsp. lactis A12]SBW29723.1 Putative membrane protein [Lactococcus lactis subsp. lactis]